MRACLVGVGQRVAGDDGVGLTVVDAVRARGVPAGVEVRDLPDATDLVAIYGEVERLVLVDAVVGFGEPGQVDRIEPDRLEAASATAISSHGVSIGRALALGRTLHPERRPDVRIVAISIERPTRHVIGLSPEVEASVPLAVEAVLAELGAS